MRFKIFLIVSILLIITLNLQAQNESKMNAKTRAMIEKAYDIFNSYDFDRISEFIDVNYIEHSPDPGQKPGLEGLKQAMIDLKNGFPDYKFIINDMVINRDKAAVLFTFTGTNTGDMMGMKATNKQVTVQGIDYLLLKDNKCTEHWGYMDMHTFMQQLGMSKD